ncbi:hypothetical protein [Bifidobacterium cuniculi]|uniref:hypothetical protein n=1 Tax=Bifidobacterium cuniculi TaxID=1688 RepID=UPI00068928B7|nr:hypothetical protein [Bifidobacterium cuniculi]
MRAGQLPADLGIDVVTTDLHDTAQAVALVQAQERPVLLVSDGSEDAAVRQAATASVVVGDADDADVTSTHMCVDELVHLSQAMMRNIHSSLAWDFVFNIVGLPLAAGVLYPFTGWMLNPMIAGVAMVLSVVCVFLNSLRLRRARI